MPAVPDILAGKPSRAQQNTAELAEGIYQNPELLLSNYEATPLALEVYQLLQNKNRFDIKNHESFLDWLRCQVLAANDCLEMKIRARRKDAGWEENPYPILAENWTEESFSHPTKLRYRLTEESLPAEYQVRITVKDATQVALDPDKVLALARDQENPGKLLDRVRELLRSRQDFPQSDYVSALHWLDDIFAEAVIELLKESYGFEIRKSHSKTSPRNRKDMSTEDASKPAKRPREETPSPEELRTSTPSPQTRRKTSQPSGSQAETPAKQRAKENPGNPQKKKKTENPTTAEPERRMVTRSIAIEQGTSNKPQKQTPVVQIQTRKTVATTRQTVRGSPYRGKLVELRFSPLQPGKPAVLTWVRPQGPLRTDPNESPVRKDARRRWEAWGQEVVDEEGFKSRKARGTPGTKTPHPPPPSSWYPQLKRPQDALHPIPIEEDLFPEPFEGRGLFSRTRSFRRTPSPPAAGHPIGEKDRRNSVTGLVALQKSILQPCRTGEGETIPPPTTLRQ
ncbi:hypothetical protein BDZ89DRAFT_1126956 [Hymenopellis radicata]|nr:hypothetical protein BDZ89DRAFT_1126956 [Hymenopellis radicata]